MNIDDEIARFLTENIAPEVDEKLIREMTNNALVDFSTWIGNAPYNL